MRDCGPPRTEAIDLGKTGNHLYSMGRKNVSLKTLVNIEHNWANTQITIAPSVDKG